MKKIFPALMILALAASAHAAPRSVDVTAFDVAGVKLGMTPEDAKAALKASFGVDDEAIVDDKFPGKDSVTGEKIPSYFSVKSGNHSLLIHHVTNLRDGKQPARAVTRIEYEMPYTEENVVAMREAALGKYGENANSPNTLPMHWCEHPHENTGIGCDRHDEPRLELAQTRIVLEDPRYRQAIIDWQEKQQSEKPKF
ncbi:MAG: hypothetical protein Q4A06_03380 [Cardiobacteriaceae bacterium]|nr:hypothetical protein [Cardiobacteriaceae bacterium]